MTSTTPTTVNDIMETMSRVGQGYTHIDRAIAPAVIQALSAIPGFVGKNWTNTFCHGRYTSPSAKWTAEDTTGRVQISWSVNAATGADNGYFLSRDSHWDASDRRAEASAAAHEAWAAKRRDENIVRLSDDVQRYENRVSHWLLDAYRELAQLRGVRDLNRHAALMESVAAGRRRAAADMEALRAIRKEYEGLLALRDRLANPSTGMTPAQIHRMKMATSV